MATRKKKPEPLAWCPKFLTVLASGKSITRAAKEAGVSRQTAYQRRTNDEQFAAAWADAEAAALDVLRDEIHRRGVEGWVEREEYEFDPDTGQRELKLQVRKYSDTLLIFEMKKRDHSYRENVRIEGTLQHQVSGAVALLEGRQPIEVPADKRRAAAALLLQQAEDENIPDAEVVEDE